MESKNRGTPEELVQFYQSKRWKKVRALIIRRDHGICQECGGPGKEVHHKIPLSLNNYQTELAVDPENLVLLCTSCHNAQRSDGYVRRDVMFDEHGRLIKREKE